MARRTNKEVEQEARNNEQAKQEQEAPKQEQATTEEAQELKDGEMIYKRISAKVTAVLTTDENGEPSIAKQTNAEAKEKKVVLPKTYKAEAQEQARKIIAGKCYNVMIQQAQARKTNAESTKNGENATAEQIAKAEQAIIEANAIIKQAEAELTKIGLNAEQARSIKNPTAELLSVFWCNGALSVELKPIIDSLQALETITNGALLKYYAGEQLQASKEEREVITTAKQAIKDTLTTYTAENELFNAFKLSVSDADLVAFYRAVYAEKNGASVNLLAFTAKNADKNRREFTKILVSWLLRKMRATAEA